MGGRRAADADRQAELRAIEPHPVEIYLLVDEQEAEQLVQGVVPERLKTQAIAALILAEEI